MNEFQKASPTSSSINRKPFIGADAVLVLTAIVILIFSGKPISGAACCCITLLMGLGAWLAVLPWFLEFRAATSETSAFQPIDLSGVEAGIQKMNSLAAGIQSALAPLATVQESTAAVSQKAGEMEAKIAAYSQELSEKITQLSDHENNLLQAEVDKSHRTEDAWLSAGTGMMDHILAFSSAGIHSGKPEIVEQMRRFRTACLEIAARVGLQPYVPNLGEPYNAKSHELPVEASSPVANSKIGRVLAPGITYQGQLIRKALVVTEEDVQAHEMASAPADITRSFTPAEPMEEEENGLVKEGEEAESENTIVADSPTAPTPTEEVSSPEALEETPEATVAGTENEPEPELSSTEIPDEPTPVSEEPAANQGTISGEGDPFQDDSDLFRQTTFKSILDPNSDGKNSSSPSGNPMDDEGKLPL